MNRQRFFLTLAVCAIFSVLLNTLIVMKPGDSYANSSFTAYPLPGTPSPRTPSQTQIVYLPLVPNKFPPNPTLSRYMSTADSTTLYNEGCTLGTVAESGQNAVVILDFGQPFIQNSIYGVRTFDSGLTFHSTSEIEVAAEQFLIGYWNCSPDNAVVTLAVGLNNSFDATKGNFVNSSHGQAWAQMVKNINTWIASPPSLSSKEQVAGAMDIEMDFNDPVSTRSWVDGYATVTTLPLYDFGDCGGCPLIPATQNVMVNNGWHLDDIWWVSWYVTPSYPLPEIYLTPTSTFPEGNAKQWYGMSLYAFTYHTGHMIFKGSFTQWQACQDRPDSNCLNHLTDNTPGQGYLQLYKYLNSDSHTTQGLDWSTDITWQN